MGSQVSPHARRWSSLAAAVALAAQLSRCAERAPAPEPARPDPPASAAPATAEADRASEAEPPPALADRAVWGGVEVALSGSGRHAIILLHGYGSSGEDVVPLAARIGAALPVRLAVPTSPREWAPGGGGRAWFERGEADTDAQVERAAREIVAIRDGLVAEGRAPSDVIVAGFSQGGSLALEVAMSMDPPPRAIVVFSGRVLTRFGGRWSALAGMPVFVSHGRSDPLIPFSDGELTVQRATDAGATVTFVPFDGGHEVPPEVVERAIDFLTPFVDRSSSSSTPR